MGCRFAFPSFFQVISPRLFSKARGILRHRAEVRILLFVMGRDEREGVGLIEILTSIEPRQEMDEIP